MLPLEGDLHEPDSMQSTGWLFVGNGWTHCDQMLNVCDTA